MNKVEIVNLALARLGESPIQDFDEGSVPANMAKSFYPQALRAVLRDYNWNFALATAKLARLAEDPVDFHFAFALPADCLRVIRLRREGAPDGGTGGGGPRYVLRGDRLLTDVEFPVIEYVRDVTDTTQFDDKFIEALSYRLASDLAMPVKGSTDLMANYNNVYTALVQQAAAISAGEQRTTGRGCNPYVEARF